jgi:hypothetical protein
MIHPFLKKLATEPTLFVEHASAYASLATLEAREVGLALRRRALALSACASLGMLALAFSGLAVMLAAAVPWQSMPAPWVLVGLPVALWLVCGVLWWMGSRQPLLQPFTHLRQQWAADTQLVRDVAQSA